MITIPLPGITVNWIGSDLNAPTAIGTALGNQQVLAVRHASNDRAVLSVDLSLKGITDPIVMAQIRPSIATVELIQHSVEDDSNGKQISVSSTSSKKIAFTINPVSTGPDKPFPFFLQFDMNTLLKKLGTRVNMNLIEAKVTIAGNGFTAGPIASQQFLHIAKQQVIVFLPGVAGSKIETEAHQGEDSFPAWSVSWMPGVDEFGRLICDREGLPTPGGQAHNTELLEDFSVTKDIPKVQMATVGGLLMPILLLPALAQALTTGQLLDAFAKIKVYNARQQKIFNGPDGHPKITLGNGTAFAHYVFEPWPYDWRLKLEIPKAMLLKDPMPSNAAGGPANIGKLNEGLSDILARRRKQLPLMDDKLVVSGHSTGGVILRGLLSDSRAQQLVNKCFFIDVPFFGAPKAYFVYLTGTFLPFLGPGLLQKTAPNLPIVYYLAPTERFNDNAANTDPARPLPDVALVPSGGSQVATGRSVGQNVGNAIIKPFVAKLGPSRYPASIDPWNDALESAARAYHGAVTVPVIGWENCKVFFSRIQTADPANRTPGATFISPGTGDAATLSIQGDGTVPESSLKGDSPSTTWVELTAGPAHDQAANDPVVWQTMIQELTNPV
jgi:hypothetical protein